MLGNATEMSPINSDPRAPGTVSRGRGGLKFPLRQGKLVVGCPPHGCGGFKVDLFGLALTPSGDGFYYVDDDMNILEIAQ